jgi:hypothetical protein
MKKDPTSAPVAREFKVVKVDVGRFDRNVDLASTCGVPLKSSIPAIAILSTGRDVLYATRAGELADARKMGDAGIHEFFRRAAASARPGPSATYAQLGTARVFARVLATADVFYARKHGSRCGLGEPESAAARPALQVR